MKARLNWACTIAKEVLEVLFSFRFHFRKYIYVLICHSSRKGCEIILESSSYAETIVDLVRALKSLSEIIK